MSAIILLLLLFSEVPNITLHTHTHTHTHTQDLYNGKTRKLAINRKVPEDPDADPGLESDRGCRGERRVWGLGFREGFRV